MAKISTYTTVTPQLGDMLIGTDVNDMNMTKNFTVGDILDLGGFVPYTGATGDVDLGVHGLTSTRLTVSNNAEINQVSAYGNTFYIVDNLVTAPGLQLEFANNKYYLGDVISNVNGTYVLVDDANSRIEFSKAIRTNGSTGTSGQVLTSQGAGSPATWVTPAYVTAVYGSFYDMNDQTTLGSTEELMEFGTTDISSGVTIVNNGLGNPTEITVSSTGVYKIQFSAQLLNTTGGTSEVYIYLKKNGAIVPDSNTRITLANNGHYVVAAWNFFLQLNAGQYAEIAWYSTTNHVSIQTLTAPVGLPAIPSTILTVNRVS